MDDLGLGPRRCVLLEGVRAAATGELVHPWDNLVTPVDVVPCLEGVWWHHHQRK